MKQHYIPRCYLKRFSDNEKSIHAFDKAHNKSYRASLMSVCCEEDLYTLSDEYVKKSRDESKGKVVIRYIINILWRILRTRFFRMRIYRIRFFRTR